MDYQNEEEADYSYCDCECICEESDNENYECKCECACASFHSVNHKGEKTFKLHDVELTLPSKISSKKLPTLTPIKVRIPRGKICNSLPNGIPRKTLCEPESFYHNTVPNGILNVCILVLPGAQVGKAKIDSTLNIPIRVKKDIEAANQIWQTRVNERTIGVKFNVVSTFIFHKDLNGIGENAEDFPWNQNDIGKICFQHGLRICPKAHVFVFYMKGDSIGPILSNGARTDAITFRRFPVIIMSNSAQSKNYILAHELGHIMYLNNLLGYPFDPDPAPRDPDHNVNPSNLMYYKSDYWPLPPNRPTITAAQIRKALHTRFFYE
jgi:hypothetical protein